MGPFPRANLNLNWHGLASDRPAQIRIKSVSTPNQIRLSTAAPRSAPPSKTIFSPVRLKSAQIRGGTSTTEYLHSRSDHDLFLERMGYTWPDRAHFGDRPWHRDHGLRHRGV